MHVHLVFVTKYRRTVFTKQILEDLRDIFVNVCRDFEAELIEFEGEEDHVHLLVNYPPKVTVSKLVNGLKGVSSRLLRKKQYPSILQSLWETTCGLLVILQEPVGGVHLPSFVSTSNSNLPLQTRGAIHFGPKGPSFLASVG